MAIFLSELLKKIPPDTKERVERIRIRLSNVIRENLRKETGLLLNRHDYAGPSKPKEPISVPIRLTPGLPESLRKFVFDDAWALTLKIFPYRGHLLQTESGLVGIKKLLEELVKGEQGRNIIDERDVFVSPIQELIEDLLRVIGNSDPVKEILKVNEDVLGIYHFQIPHKSHLFHDPFEGSIELYWAVIGLISEMLGVGVEPLTAVVMIHELAHAYTHLGCDIDGKRWGSLSFSQSERGLVEGLAQYYTAVLSAKVDNQVPGTRTAYETLLGKQPEDYKTHVSWTKEHRPEEIRYALLSSRRKGQTTLDDFSTYLQESYTRLRADEPSAILAN